MIYTTVCVVRSETHTIWEVCELNAVLPGPETQRFEHHFRIKMIVENVTSDVLELNENLHLHIVLSAHNHQSIPHSIIRVTESCSRNEGAGEEKR